MLGAFIFLIIIIFKADAQGPDSENPVIRLSFNDDRNKKYTVWKDKPLTIIIENAYARLVWCSDKYQKKFDEKFVPETEYSNNNNIILNINEVTAEMSTRWVCTVLQEYHGPQTPYIYKNRNYTANYVHLNLHVKGARAVILTANSRSLTYVTTNLSVKYDGEANYTYEDGEAFPMDFTCKKSDDDDEQDTLHLEYYNAEGILLFRTERRPKNPHIFRSVLKSNNDKYYLDCTRTARYPIRVYRYRTTFFKSDLNADAVQHAVILSVNGQRLSPLSNKDKSYYYDDYIFSFIDGEVLNVTCRKMKFYMRGSLVFHYDKEIVHLMSQTRRSQSEAVISLNISTLAIENKSLVCSINNTDVEKPNARLLFRSDVPFNDIRIRGLPRNNILYQYTNDEYQWTIEYQYSVNDTLNLTCVSNGEFDSSRQNGINPFLWEFEGYQRSVDSAGIGTPDSQIRFSESPFTKILDATHNGTKIQCVYYLWYSSNTYKTVQIILRLKPELDLEAKRNEETSGETSTHSYTLVYCLTAAGVSVIILIILYFTVKKSYLQYPRRDSTQTQFTMKTCCLCSSR